MNYEALPGIADALEQVQMYEAKKKDTKGKVKRWWDDDGDGKGYEKGEVDGSFKKEEVELDENRAAARAAGGYKDDSKKQTDPSKAGFTGISGSIKDIMRQNKEIEAANKAKAKKEEVELEEAKNKEGKEQGVDGKACWKGYKYAGTENGKDKCVPANEELEAIEANLIESGLFSVDEVRYIIGEKFDELEEATAMAKRGHDETAIRNKIAANTGGGKSADRATALEKKPTYGDDKSAKQRSDYARKQRGDFRKTTSSSPGLHGYGHKSDQGRKRWSYGSHHLFLPWSAWLWSQV